VKPELATSALSRRALLRGAAVTALGLALPSSLRAALAPAAPRALAFRHTHTGESGRVVYFADGAYLAEGLERIDLLLRDHYSGEVKPIDRRLLDLLHALNEALGTDEPFHVISGYRSPATNAMLAARSGGVATHSLHMSAQAVDLRVPGRALAKVREAALALRRGGVGYYPGPDFVHVDVGRVRRW
jgi:uncharacterized protein YcbK (DUF882 family)